MQDSKKLARNGDCVYLGRVMTKSQKFIDNVLNKSASKWQSITNFNLSKELTKQEATDTLAKLNPLLVKKYEEKVAYLKTLRCPDVVLVSYEKQLKRAREQKLPEQRLLIRVIEN